MTDAQYAAWESAMVAGLTKKQPPVPKYKGGSMPPRASMHDIADWPDWMLRDKLDGDVASYIIQLRSREEDEELSRQDRKELDEWRELLDDDMSDVNDVQDKLNAADGLEDEIQELKDAATADDELVLELKRAVGEAMGLLAEGDARSAVEVLAAVQKRADEATAEEDE